MAAYLTCSQLDLRSIDMDVRLADLIERLADYVEMLAEENNTCQRSPRATGRIQRLVRAQGLTLAIPVHDEPTPVSYPMSEIEYLDQRIQRLASEFESLDTQIHSLNDGHRDRTRQRATSLPAEMVQAPTNNLSRSDSMPQIHASHILNNTFAETLQAQIRQMSAEASHAVHVQDVMMEVINIQQTTLANPVLLFNSANDSVSRAFSSNERDILNHHGIIAHDFAIDQDNTLLYPPRTLDARGLVRPRVSSDSLGLQRNARRGNPWEVQYDYRHEIDNSRTLVVFDRSCLEHFRRLTQIEDIGQTLQSVIRVYVENCMHLVDMDQLVAYELNQARDRFILSDETAEELWSS
ncbi:hypothetical protein DOTSEDRAFT_19328 [Dothistroma septosporum NZE10]|uniref:Uncharacterized protein n=1 Tax=Dothistroma septosporum (strain NZE10 / CBS 128990) TaxID=675120 RepID=N1PZ59_DOTSN|nr:hypothetical protein DOTSEDRAFT_19328 [Dothistroma septosporum NZE10]